MKKWIDTAILTFVIIYFLIASIGQPYDDTDLVHEDMKVRSGLQLIIDYGTGCQYIAKGSLLSQFGITSPQLTPRLDTYGQPMCIQADWASLKD